MARQTENESVPVQEVETPTMVSVRKFAKSVLIVLLSFACIFAGMLMYQLRLPEEDFPPVTHERKTPMLKKPMMASTSIRTEKKVEPVLSVSEDVTNKSSVFVTVPKQEDKPVPAVTETEPKTVEPVQEPVKEEVKPEVIISVKPVEPTLPLETALDLRDHLALGVSCLPEFKSIMKNRVPAGINRENLIETLMPVCANQTIFEDMEKAFKENKKRALMTYYMLNNPAWLAYLKTFGATLVDVRRLNPVKHKPKDIVSLAQSALVAHRVFEAQNYIQRLPNEMKADFSEFLRLSAAYVKAQVVTNKLILSFGKKGE